MCNKYPEYGTITIQDFREKWVCVNFVRVDVEEGKKKGCEEEDKK